MRSLPDPKLLLCFKGQLGSKHFEFLSLQLEGLALVVRSLTDPKTTPSLETPKYTVLRKTGEYEVGRNHHVVWKAQREVLPDWRSCPEIHVLSSMQTPARVFQPRGRQRLQQLVQQWMWHQAQQRAACF